MVAFVILFMFFVGLALGAWATAYYFQIVSPDRVRSFITHLQQVRAAEDVAWGADASRMAMQDLLYQDESPAAPLIDTESDDVA